MGKRKENFIKKWGMTPSEFRKIKKQRHKILVEIKNKERIEYARKSKALYEDENWENGGGLEDEIDEDSHCDMVAENY